jgi:hypothetical protein
VLDVSRNPLDHGIAELAAAPPPASLHTLRLADCDLGRTELQWLAECPWFGQLLELDLAKLPIDQSVLERLTGVKSLSVANATLGNSCDLGALWRTAVHLDLSFAAMALHDGPELLTLALGKSWEWTIRELTTLSFPKLYSLDLSTTLFDPDMLERLLRSKLQLARLRVGRVELDDTCVDVLCRLGVGTVQELDLRGTDYSLDAMMKLTRSEALRSVKLLRVSFDAHGHPLAIRDEIDARWGKDWRMFGEVDEIDDDEGQA